MNDHMSRLDEIEDFFVEKFHQDWFSWAEVTRMLRVLEEKALYREEGYATLSDWLGKIRMKTVSRGEFRYMFDPGRKPGST